MAGAGKKKKGNLHFQKSRKSWAVGLGKSAAKMFKGLPPPPQFMEKKKKAQQAQAKKAEAVEAEPPKKKSSAWVPYKPNQKILLVGEGNFSFASSLAEVLGTGSDIVATSYDTLPVLSKKYLDAEDCLTAFTAAGGKVLHGVDCTALASHAARSAAYAEKNPGEEAIVAPPYDAVVFNFPHTGLGIKDETKNIAANQILVSGFIASAMEVLHPEGEIHLTTKRGDPYDKWRVVPIATEIDGVRLKNSFDFDPKLYPGYRHRRTIGHEAGVSTNENEDIATSDGNRTYVFARKINELDQKVKLKPNAAKQRLFKGKKGRKLERKHEERAQSELGRLGKRERVQNPGKVGTGKAV